MYLPSDFISAFVLMFITMICWGSWANTAKIDRKWRFELYYIDYTIGVFFMSIVIGLTLGSFGSDGVKFLPNLLQSSWSLIAKAGMSGVIFNVANYLLVAAISITGIAIAFPIGIGIALLLGTVLSYIVLPKGNPYLLFIGMLLILAAVVLDGRAYQRSSVSKKKTGKGIVVAVISGIFMSLFYPLLSESMIGDFSLSPYSAVCIFSLGIVLCHAIISPIFMKKPLIGKKLSFQKYKLGKVRQHCYGLLGGIIWSIGTSFNLIAQTRTGPGMAFAFGQGATLVAAVWGVFIWKEFKKAKKVNLLLSFMFCCYILGLCFIAFSSR